MKKYGKKVPCILVGLKSDLRSDPRTIEALQRRGDHFCSADKVHLFYSNPQTCNTNQESGKRNGKPDRSNAIPRMLRQNRRRHPRSSRSSNTINHQPQRSRERDEKERQGESENAERGWRGWEIETETRMGCFEEEYELKLFMMCLDLITFLSVDVICRILQMLLDIKKVFFSASDI
jgi:hypothetical protein